MSSAAMLRAATRLCWLALCAAGILAGGAVLRGAEPLHLEAPPFVVSEETAPGPLFVPEAAPQFELTPSPQFLPPAAPVGDCGAGIRYWIVSSREAPQDYSRIGCGHLDVFERRCDGQLYPTALSTLVAQLQPGAPVLLFMHGSYVSWEDNCLQSDGTWWWLRRGCPQLPVNVIFLTWPSDRTRCLLAPCELKRQGIEAEVNAFYAAALLAYLPDCHPVCLLGHSYGARMAMATLHLAGGGALHGVTFRGGVGHKRMRAVLAAGALDHDWLNEDGRYCQALCRAECVLNMRNRHDVALKAYPLLRPLLAHRALGASGVTWLDRRQQPCTGRIHDLDVTGVIGFGHFWPNYYETPQLARSIAPWVYFPEVNPGYASALPVAASTAPRLLQPASVTAELPAEARVRAVTRSLPQTTRSIPDRSVSTPQPASAGRPRAQSAASPPTARATTTQGGLIGWLHRRGE